MNYFNYKYHIIHIEDLPDMRHSEHLVYGPCVKCDYNFCRYIKIRKNNSKVTTVNMEYYADYNDKCPISNKEYELRKLLK